MKRCVYPTPFKVHVEALMRKCLEHIQHGEYQLTFEYSQVADEADVEHSRCRASIYVNTDYLYATVTVYPALLDFWKDKKYWDLGECLLHEACHLLIEPVAVLFMWNIRKSERADYRGIIERQTQRVCNAVLRHLPERWYLPEVSGKT